MHSARPADGRVTRLGLAWLFAIAVGSGCGAVG